MLSLTSNAQRLLKRKDTVTNQKAVIANDSLQRNARISADSSQRKLSVAVPDSLKKKSESLETTVVYAAKDSTIMDTEKQIVYLYGEAKVTYGQISLEADFIQLNWDKNEVRAKGSYDSVAHKAIGEPVFKQGSDEYNAKEIKYNFKSKKALIQGIVTQQGDGYIQGAKVKKDDEDNLYIRNAIYTTCNLKEPHFHISASRIKLVGKKEIVAGPFHLELNNIPLPIGLPFGFFPYTPPQESGTSGIIMPTYGEEPLNRGFYLRDGGYYFAASPNIGIRLTGEIYSKGSWGLGVNSQYVKRYRYGGNFNLQYRHATDGEYYNPQVRTDFSLAWSHSPQSRGSSSFSASVNLASNSYNQYNSSVYATQISNTTNSSVQYSKSFGQTIRTGLSFSADQNTSTKAVNASLNYTFGLNQFQPFKNKKAVTEKFWDGFRVGLDFSGSYTITNQLALANRAYNNLPYNVYRQSDATDTDPTKTLVSDYGTTAANFDRYGVIDFNLTNLSTILEKGQRKLTYSIPISLPNIKLGKYLNLTPSFNFSGNVYSQKYAYKFVPVNKYAATDSLRNLGAVEIDTLRGGFNPDYQFSFSASMNTRLYGTLRFSKGRLQGIRHVMSPSISVNYTPDFTDPKFGFYQDVQISNKGDVIRLSTFNPTLTNIGNQAGGISFSLSNTLEAKIKAKSDTAQKESEKITILDNLSFNTNYNFFASAYKLSPVSFSANSRVKKFDINFGGTLNPYKYEANSSYGLVGKQVDIVGLQYTQLSNLNFSISKSFRPKEADKPKESKNGTEGQMKQINRNLDSYVDWKMPWDFQFGYQYSYNKTGLAPTTTVSAATFSGSVKLTDKWDFKLQSGYDFSNKGISLTNLSLHRDLHCWEMQFNWIPIASAYTRRASSYSFDLRVKSSLLQELKLSRRNTFYDKGGF